MNRRAFLLGRTIAALTADVTAAVVVAVWWPILSAWDRIFCAPRHDHATAPADIYAWPPEAYERILAALREERSRG